MVVIALGRSGGLRFRDLRATVEGIIAKVLTETLRDLERDGLVARHEHAGMPPGVEYELTELGRTLHLPLQALGLWAEEHPAQVLAAREAYDSARRRTSVESRLRATTCRFDSIRLVERRTTRPCALTTNEVGSTFPSTARIRVLRASRTGER
ncbi:HxlR family transcriptional regulator [Lentzea atacamensis]|uniref:HxlR family transcriptional regulator n=2 Tax=Lentzea atacamensis TaxID=531938 RepID=A0A316HSL8_9PSEU|nr:HxlR family transcriptional regulator [Lentzea atacamensis]